MIYTHFPGAVPVSWPPCVLPMHGKESGWLPRSRWFTCGWGACLHWQLAKILASCCLSFFPLRLVRWCCVPWSRARDVDLTQKGCAV